MVIGAWGSLTPDMLLIFGQPRKQKKQGYIACRNCPYSSHNGKSYLNKSLLNSVKTFWWCGRLIICEWLDTITTYNKLKISFRRAVGRWRFHTLNTHDTKPKKQQQHYLQTPYTLELGPFPSDVAHSFPSKWPILLSVVSEKKVSSYKLHMTPLLWYELGINHWVANGG